MTLPTRNTLSKSERLHGRNAVEQLFQKAKRSSMVVFPLRAVYTLTTGEEQKGEAAVRVLVSVSKKHFKRAVKRNRAKRQVREAYRKNKHALVDIIAGMPGTGLSIAFVWLSDEPQPSGEVEASMVALLSRIGEKAHRIYDNSRKAETHNLTDQEQP